MVVGRNLNVVLVQLLEFTKIASDRQRLSFMNKAVHGLTGLLAIRNGINRKSCAVSDIPSGENIRLPRLEGHGITKCQSSAADFHPASFKKASPFR